MQRCSQLCSGKQLSLLPRAARLSCGSAMTVSRRKLKEKRIAKRGGSPCGRWFRWSWAGFKPAAQTRCSPPGSHSAGMPTQRPTRPLRHTVQPTLPSLTMSLAELYLAGSRGLRPRPSASPTAAAITRAGGVTLTPALTSGA